MTNMTDLKTNGSFSATVANRWGDPESALEQSRYELLTGSTLAHNGQYYEPIIPFEYLSRLRRINPHHSPLPAWVAGQVLQYIKPHPLIKRAELRKMWIDLETTANGFLKVIREPNHRTIIRIDYQPTINTRRAADPSRYGFITPNSREFVLIDWVDILHLMQHDTAQQVYGVPYWIGAMQSILMGEDVRVFPRLFFKNGGSTGDIIATTGLTEKEQKLVEDVTGGVNGLKRFKRIILQFAKGKIDDVLKIIPYSTGSEKIDFSKLANLSSDDVLDSWGIRSELVGMTPDTPGGSGDLSKLDFAWYKSGILPRLQALEDLLMDVLPPDKPLEFYTYAELNPTAINTAQRA